jgi:phage terminase large subunit
MKLIFDTNGNEKQKDMARAWLDPSITDIVYGGSKGSGKSYGGVNLIFGDAFLYPETHYFIARKKLNDIRKFTIPTIHEVWFNANDKGND